MVYAQEARGWSRARVQTSPSWLIIASQDRILVASCWCQDSGQGCWGCPAPCHHVPPCSHRCHQVTGDRPGTAQVAGVVWGEGDSLTVSRIGNCPPHTPDLLGEPSPESDHLLRAPGPGPLLSTPPHPVPLDTGTQALAWVHSLPLGLPTHCR